MFRNPVEVVFFNSFFLLLLIELVDILLLSGVPQGAKKRTKIVGSG
jgi:hypothetical protein